MSDEPLLEVFAISQTKNPQQLLDSLLGETSGLSNIQLRLDGDARAFGRFENDPFGLNSGIVLSTGKVEELAGKNISDGGFFPETVANLQFTKLPGVTGDPQNSDTAVFYADLSQVGFGINSILFADSGSFTGGATGSFSGFDLDGIKISTMLITSADQVNSIPSLDILDFSPARTFLSQGSQRPPQEPDNPPIAPELFGILDGNVNNSLATLDKFDSTGSTENPFGAISLGDGGQLGFDLKEPLLFDGNNNQPIYLYVGEAGDIDGETPSGEIRVSNRFVKDSSDINTDFGLENQPNDAISLQLSFFADDTVDTIYFDYVFGSEEFVEYANRVNDSFEIRLNDSPINLARLADGTQVSINRLAPNPFGGYHPDLVINSAQSGPLSEITRLDGFTKPVTAAIPIQQNTFNTLTFSLTDARDGLLDSATFIQQNSFGSFINAGTEDVGGGQNTIEFGQGGGRLILENFGGVGRGTDPSDETIAEVDTLKLSGEGLAARNMLFTLVERDLEITFEDIANTKLVLKDFSLENIDNLRRQTGATVDLGNILFDEQAEIQDSFDVFNAEWQLAEILNRNSVTFLNGLDNTTRGFDDSEDVINGLDGADHLDGLSGNDLLRGDNGNDLLIGGEGDDTLVGGAGADQFQVNAPGKGVDSLRDFSAGEGDQIWLSLSDFDIDLPLGELSPENFALGSTARRERDRLIYAPSTGELFFDADGSNTSDQIQIAFLEARPTLTHAEIFFVV
jgi:Ca2+-binding RTX toxin-like protein